MKNTDNIGKRTNRCNLIWDDGIKVCTLQHLDYRNCILYQPEVLHTPTGEPMDTPIVDNIDLKKEIRYRVEQEYEKYHNDTTFEYEGKDFWIEQIVWKLASSLNASFQEQQKALIATNKQYAEMLDDLGVNRCDECKDFLPTNDECLCENCDSMFHEGCAGYVYKGDGEYPAESAYALCKKDSKSIKDKLS